MYSGIDRKDGEKGEKAKEMFFPFMTSNVGYHCHVLLFLLFYSYYPFLAWVEGDSL